MVKNPLKWKRPVKEVIDHFNELVGKIITDLVEILNDFKTEKSRLNDLRKELVYQNYEIKKEEVIARREEAEDLMEQNNSPGKKEAQSTLKGHQEEFEELEAQFENEIRIIRGVSTTVNEDRNRIDDEIQMIDALLAYIEKVKGNLFDIDLATLYDKIEEVFKNVIRNARDEEIIARHYVPLQVKIERKAGQIISKIGAFIDDQRRILEAGRQP